MGLSWETEVSTDWVLTRLPTCVVAWPATPVISDRTWVKPRFSCSIFDRSFGGGYRSLGRLHRGLSLRLLLDIVVELALGDGAGLGQRSIALDVDLGEAELRLGLQHLPLCLRQLAFGLIERCLEGTRIDLEQDLAFGHLGAFPIILFDQIAVGLGLDLRVDIAVERADPLIGDGHVGWLDLNDRYGQGSRGPGSGRRFSTACEECRPEHQHACHPESTSFCCGRLLRPRV